MTFQNPLAFVRRREIPLVISGTDVTGYAIDLEDLEALGEEYPWFGAQMRGEETNTANVSNADMLKVASAVIATSLAPDASGADRRLVEASARNIDPNERADLMKRILVESFSKLKDVIEGAEGNDPAKPNRRQRRTARSKSGGAKQRT